MASRNKGLKIVARSPRGKASAQAAAQRPTVSARWLLIAVATTFVAAALCAWGSMCLLFWQGSWQLLYHPKTAITRTPAAAGIAFEPIGFAATQTGQLRLQGWWIPAAPGARFANVTVLYLHGATGNISESVDALAALHAAGVTVFTFDYRGYGQSQFAHPNETRWRQDANWAIEYLTGTRQLAPRSIVLDGTGLGANLAAEIAAAHPELAGVVLDAPLPHAANVIFDDPRAELVPAHLLVGDRWHLNAAASAVRIPSLWFVPANDAQSMAAYDKASGHKTLLRSATSGPAFGQTFTAWLSSLSH